MFMYRWGICYHMGISNLNRIFSGLYLYGHFAPLNISGVTVLINVANPTLSCVFKATNSTLGQHQVAMLNCSCASSHAARLVEGSPDYSATGLRQ